MNSRIRMARESIGPSMDKAIVSPVQKGGVTMQNEWSDLRKGGHPSRSCPRASRGKGKGKRALLGAFLAVFLLVAVVGWPVGSPAADGDFEWAFPTGGYVNSSPAIGTDGTIYVGSNDHKLYAINAGGTKKWDFPTGGTVYSSPAIASDGTVYVGSADGKLYALYGRSKLASTAWPMFHHDRKHTGRKP
jgi:hypothetical protein